MPNSRPGEQMDISSNSNTNTDGNTARKSSYVDYDLLKDIDDTLNSILDNMGNMSQSAARGSMPGSRNDANRWRANRRSGKLGNNGITRDVRNMSGGMLDKFTDSLEDVLLESLGASEFKRQIQGSMTSLARELNTTVDELPNLLGKELGKQIANTKPAKVIADKVKDAGSKMFEGISDAYSQGKGASGYVDAVTKGAKQGYNTLRNMFSSNQGPTDDVNPEDVSNASQSNRNVTNIADHISRVQDVSELATAGEVGSNVVEIGSILAEGGGLAEAAAAAGPALTGLASAAAAAAVPILAAVAALMIIDKLLETLGPAIEGTKAAFEAASSASNRYQDQRKKNLELEKKRISEDFNSMIKEPFEILEQAAQRLYDAWDNQIQTITATQGYNKADVQDLMSAYAQRLRDEGLTKVVSGADIMDNLSKVLESGLSGQVAEEFAYLATKLNAAVPTQDFFSYADTYASVAANAIKSGKSQQEAIEYANREMETFASNVLFASRQLSGGFSSGLKDAQQLFNYAVQIANASKEGDAALISGVLTSVSAITGAIAPDLASGIVEAVVKAAIGGNSSEIVALRSLAGINASNTEFLKALAQDPQGIFTALFSNLAKMQNMSNDNFMEVAEGLSSVFGISMDAFARVDFNYLADSVSKMNVNNASLEENMQLLVSGQTTSTAEQMKMAQINQYMLEEGLSYVLDNEAARAIQQHMWDEQMMREIQESEYAVNLQGAALTFLEGIKQTVDNIKNFINPLAYMKKLGNLSATIAESVALKADVRQLLELGKVGRGNPKSLYNLTTTNKDLKLVKPITELMGGFSMYGSISRGLDLFNQATNYSGDVLSSYTGSMLGLMSSLNRAGFPNSKYSWVNVSKSAYSSVAATPINDVGIGGAQVTSSSSTADLAKQKSNAMFQKFLGTMDKAVEDFMTYEEWADTSKKFGIKDLSQALEDYGRSEEELKGAFANKEAVAASQYNHNRDVAEDEFWKQGTPFFMNQQEAWTKWENLVTEKEDLLIEQMKNANTFLSHLEVKVGQFMSHWVSYYVDHTAYTNATMHSFEAADILNSEKKENGDAVLALADALTQNTIGIERGFKDPVVQTNVLLAKILIVAEAIMQQNNKTGSLSLPDALSALGLGMTSESV